MSIVSICVANIGVTHSELRSQRILRTCRITVVRRNRTQKWSRLIINQACKCPRITAREMCPPDWQRGWFLRERMMRVSRDSGELSRTHHRASTATSGGVDFARGFWAGRIVGRVRRGVREVAILSGSLRAFRDRRRCCRLYVATWK